jgi:hypothetical protein
MAGTYKRTEEIKQKQREKMLQKTQEYDWDSIVEKRNKTIKENDIKVGRKKGDGPKKKGWFKQCKCCENEFWVTPSRSEKSFYCSRECMYSDPEYKNKLKNIDRSYMNTEDYAKCKGNPNPSKFKRYRNKVEFLTEQTYVKFIEEINPNNHPRTLAGIQGGYHLDHIVSVKEGFINGWSPEKLADKENLQMLPWLENVRKGSNGNIF